MLNWLDNSFSYIFATIFVVFAVRFFLRQNAQRQAELEAAERARHIAEANAERARQQAEIERIRAAQLEAAAQTRKQMKDEADAENFWDGMAVIGANVLLGFLGVDSGDQ